jgi:hypothetical protein
MIAGSEKYDEKTIAKSQRSSAIIFTVSIIISSIFISRDILITSDDIFYLEYFYNKRYINIYSISELFEEPVFKIYTNIMQNIFTDLNNIRILIFLTLIGHIYLAIKEKSVRGIIYILSFFLFVELAPHLSFVQLRQGLAISLMCFVLDIKSKYLQLFAILVCGLIHTSSLIMAPFLILRYFPYQFLVGSIIFFLILSIFFPTYLLEYSNLLGRREIAYQNVDATYSYLYPIYSTLILFFVIYLFRNRWRDKNFLAYIGMFVFTVPMFFIPIFGAFAERIFFFVKWYELRLLVKSESEVSRQALLLYATGNVCYTAYHSWAYSLNGGVLDRYLAMTGMIEYIK